MPSPPHTNGRGLPKCGKTNRAERDKSHFEQEMFLWALLLSFSVCLSQLSAAALYITVVHCHGAFGPLCIRKVMAFIYKESIKASSERIITSSAFCEEQNNCPYSKSLIVHHLYHSVLSHIYTANMAASRRVDRSQWSIQAICASTQNAGWHTHCWTLLVQHKEAAMLYTLCQNRASQPAQPLTVALCILQTVLKNVSEIAFPLGCLTLE